MILRDKVVDLAAQTDRQLSGGDTPAVGSSATIQASSPVLSIIQERLLQTQTKLWSRWLAAIGFMRTAVDSYVGSDTARALLTRTGRHGEDAKPANQQHLEEDVQGHANTDNVTWSLQERELQVGICSRLQDEQREKAPKEDGWSLPCISALTLARQINVSERTSQADDEGPPASRNGEDDVR